MSTRYKASTLLTVTGTWAGCGGPSLGRIQVDANTAGSDIILWLPPAATNRYRRITKTAAANTLTIRASGQAPLWGSTTATATVTGLGDSAEFASNGVSWYSVNPTTILR